MRLIPILLWLLTAALAAGGTYYVAHDGSPNNPGSETQPWPDLTHAISRVNPDDTIYVRQGLWRQPQQLTAEHGARSGTDGQLIRIVNYPGESPRFYGSGPFSDPAQWTQADSSIWRTADQSIDGYDVGCIWHDDRPSQQKTTRTELSKAWDFWFDAENKCVYVFCPTNPAEAAKVIEIPVGRQWEHTFTIKGVHHLLLEGLTIQYTNTHGIQLGDVHHITIRKCTVSHGGGPWIWEGQPVRYGNAIELYGSGHDILVEACQISHYFDSGFTNQGDSGEQYNITCRRNYLHHIKCGLEFWATGSMNVRDICYEENRIEYTGDNWAENLQNVWGAVRLMRQHPNGIGRDQPNQGVVERFVVRNNTIAHCGSQTGGMLAPQTPFLEHPSIRAIGGPFIIENNTITAGRSDGIYVSDDFHGIIRNNIITDCAGQPIRIQNSPKAVIENNTLKTATQPTTQESPSTADKM